MSAEKSDLIVTARVQVVLEVSFSQPWAKNVTAEQVYEQAAKEAIDHVRRFNERQRGSGQYGEIVGEPTVKMVIFEKSK